MMQSSTGPISYGVKVFESSKEKMKIFESYEKDKFSIKCQEVFYIEQSGRKVCIVERISSTNLHLAFDLSGNSYSDSRGEQKRPKGSLKIKPILFLKGYSLSNLQFDLDEGDVINIRNIQFNVKEVILCGLKGNVSESKVWYNREVHHQQKLQEDEEVPCRICLNTNPDRKNNQYRLLNACSCSGSIGRIHFYCLRTWLRIKKQNHPHSAVVCDICKQPFKVVFEIEDKIFDVKPIKTPKSGNLLILQGKFQGTLNNIVVVANEGDSIHLGKSKNNKIVIKDQRLQDRHAVIKFDQGQFYIYDQKTVCQAFKYYRTRDSIQNMIEERTQPIRTSKFST